MECDRAREGRNFEIACNGSKFWAAIFTSNFPLQMSGEAGTCPRNHAANRLAGRVTAEFKEGGYSGGYIRYVAAQKSASVTCDLKVATLADICDPRFPARNHTRYYRQNVSTKYPFKPRVTDCLDLLTLDGALAFHLAGASAGRFGHFETRQFGHFGLT